MSWLKSPWFWLLLVLGAVLVWLLFFRSSGSPKRAAAPSNLGFGAPFRGLMDSIEARFSIGDSIMGTSGSG